MTHPSDPAAVAETYFRAWTEHDWDALRAVLADDATFRGPLGAADSGDECLLGLRGMSQIVTGGVNVLKRWVDGPDVLTWFELHTTVAEPTQTVNWSRVVDGRITEIRVTFDARSPAPPGA